MHLVLGEKFTKLGIKLSGQGFVMSKNQSRLLNISNEVRHSKSLTRPRHTEQSLLTDSHLETACELSNSRRLITGGLKFTMKTKLWHTYILYNFWADYAKLRPELISQFYDFISKIEYSPKRYLKISLSASLAFSKVSIFLGIASKLSKPPSR